MRAIWLAEAFVHVLRKVFRSCTSPSYQKYTTLLLLKSVIGRFVGYPHGSASIFFTVMSRLYFVRFASHRVVSRAPQAMASPRVKNCGRVPLLDHEEPGALAPRCPARMLSIARTIQRIEAVQQLPINS